MRLLKFIIYLRQIISTCDYAKIRTRQNVSFYSRYTRNSFTANKLIYRPKKVYCTVTVIAVCCTVEVLTVGFRVTVLEICCIATGLTIC